MKQYRSPKHFLGRESTFWGQAAGRVFPAVQLEVGGDRGGFRGAELLALQYASCIVVLLPGAYLTSQILGGVPQLGSGYSVAMICSWSHDIEKVEA